MSRGPGHDPDHPILLLKAVTTAAADLNVHMARALGMGVADLRALDHLLQAGPTGPNELGRLLGITSPAATALADRLERSGHVRRSRDPGDRRRVALVPTAQAVKDVRRVLDAFVADLDALLAAMPAAERDVVARFLTAVRDVEVEHVDRLRAVRAAAS